MKPVLVLCLSLLLLAPHAVSGAGLASEILAGKLLAASGVREGLEESFFSGIRPIFDQLRKKGGSEAMIQEMMDVAKKFYEENYKWETVRPIIAKTYAAELSDDDMKAMTAFFETPAGKVAATKLTKLTHKGSEEAVASLQSKMPALQAAMLEVVQKHTAKKAP